MEEKHLTMDDGLRFGIGFCIAMIVTLTIWGFFMLLIIKQLLEAPLR